MARKGGSYKPAVIRTTLLVVGEGPDDQAFIKHIKGLFYKRDCGKSVKVEAEDGGSPGNIISNAIRKFRSFAYDQRFLVLDADIPPTADDWKKAKLGGYEIILWEPKCLEGALLEVLGERVGDHETSQQLKTRLHPRLKGHHTDYKAYEVLFPKPVLEQAENVSIKRVLRLIV